MFSGNKRVAIFNHKMQKKDKLEITPRVQQFCVYDQQFAAFAESRATFYLSKFCSW